MKSRTTRRIARLTAIVAGIATLLSTNWANAGGIYTVSAIATGTPKGISDTGQILVGNSLYQNGVVTPLAIPASWVGNNHTVISSNGTIAYSDGYMGSTHV